VNDLILCLVVLQQPIKKETPRTRDVTSGKGVKLAILDEDQSHAH